jgi:hypothetical protein
MGDAPRAGDGRCFPDKNLRLANMENKRQTPTQPSMASRLLSTFESAGLAATATFASVLWIGLALPGLPLLPGVGGGQNSNVAISLSSAVLGVQDSRTFAPSVGAAGRHARLLSLLLPASDPLGKELAAKRPDTSARSGTSMVVALPPAQPAQAAAPDSGPRVAESSQLASTASAPAPSPPAPPPPPRPPAPSPAPPRVPDPNPQTPAPPTDPSTPPLPTGPDVPSTGPQPPEAGDTPPSDAGSADTAPAPDPGTAPDPGNAPGNGNGNGNGGGNNPNAGGNNPNAGGANAGGNGNGNGNAGGNNPNAGGNNPNAGGNNPKAGGANAGGNGNGNGNGNGAGNGAPKGAPKKGP